MTASSCPDHRHDNRNGELFDRGETFSGVDYTAGLKAVEKLKELFPKMPLALLALKWVLMFEEVSCVIPGASKTKQVISNLAAGNLSDFTRAEMQAIAQVYDQHIRSLVHHLW